MNVVNSGSRYQIYGEDVKTYKRLPIASYEVSFSPMSGFFLTLRPDLAVNEDKIYGNHEVRVNKVLRSFAASTRNFGVILSGQKGIGKSLFARLLATKSIDSGLPVIMVNNSIPGVADFLASIDQEVVVIFDEFEKTFGERDDFDPQESLLSLFDGIDNGKKLFVITCNETNRLNSYLLNRPGRFHYHFTISNPSDDEIREYMTDKLKEEYHHYIERIVRFGKTVNVTYDYLRAIAFELNQGYTLEEALSDLNITRTSDVYFDVEATMTDGSVYGRYHIGLDVYSTEDRWFRAYGKFGRIISFEFAPADIKYDKNQMYVLGEGIKFEIDRDDFSEMSDADFKKMRANLAIERITFTKCDSSASNKFTLCV